jgi:hypothetical protein
LIWPKTTPALVPEDVLIWIEVTFFFTDNLKCSSDPAATAVYSKYLVLMRWRTKAEQSLLHY